MKRGPDERFTSGESNKAARLQSEAVRPQLQTRAPFPSLSKLALDVIKLEAVPIGQDLLDATLHKIRPPPIYPPRDYHVLPNASHLAIPVPHNFPSIPGGVRMRRGDFLHPLINPARVAYYEIENYLDRAIVSGHARYDEPGSGLRHELGRTRK